jgi:Fe2+ or Zn2+ uptake regulation protein
MSLESLMAAKATKTTTLRSALIAALPSHRQAPITVTELLARLPKVFSDAEYNAVFRQMECEAEIRWIKDDVYRLQLTPKVTT